MGSKEAKEYIDNRVTEAMFGSKSDEEVLGKAIVKIIKSKAQEAGVEPKRIVDYIVSKVR